MKIIETMTPWVVEGGVGIGPLKVGMSRQEIETILSELHSQLGGRKPFSPGRDERVNPTDHHYMVRYFVGNSVGGMGAFFLIDYNNDNQTVSVSINYDSDCLHVTLLGLPVFTTTAEKLVELLKDCGPCVHDGADPLLADQLAYPTLGIRFWRENFFVPDCQDDPEWQRKCAAVERLTSVEDICDVLEDQYGGVFFNIVSAYDPDYGKELCYL